MKVVWAKVGSGRSGRFGRFHAWNEAGAIVCKNPEGARGRTRPGRTKQPYNACRECLARLANGGLRPAPSSAFKPGHKPTGNAVSALRKWAAVKAVAEVLA